MEIKSVKSHEQARRNIKPGTLLMSGTPDAAGPKSPWRMAANQRSYINNDWPADCRFSLAWAWSRHLLLDSHDGMLPQFPPSVLLDVHSA